MNDYFVFGGCLRSELEFSDLSPATGPGHPNWELRLETSDPPTPIELQGTRWIEADWVYRLYRVKDGLLLEYGATGCYGIFAGGHDIVWYPGTGVGDHEILLEMARAIMLGPVMALTLHQAGLVCLHGSAVTIGDEAVAFLAPKFHGKSTLALALAAAGGRLLTDDLVAIDPGPAPVVIPGVHSVRVMQDAAERLGTWFPEATLTRGFKTTFTNLPHRSLAWEPAPLAGIYLLDPREDLGNGRSASRSEPLSGARAAAALAHGKKLTDGLVGAAAAGSMLAGIAVVTSSVPVRRLAVIRDLERLPHAVAEIMAWHGGAAPGNE